jgi:hypothetical protein
VEAGARVDDGGGVNAHAFEYCVPRS